MDIIIERACGLNVQKENITACIMTLEGKKIQTFSTKNDFIKVWLQRYVCTPVAMENTSFYRKPIVKFLESKGVKF
ncbi:hypothetical protein BW892_27100 [Bacillus cereus]|uniref:Uncharacterized protein n=1 Tax=Bacillus cereus TaxID=1396 RepID=A0A1S9U698_BACCE|nr:hypothetical protein BW892_27100 [Bacillus cereus]